MSEHWADGDGQPIPTATWKAMQDALREQVPMELRGMTFQEPGEPGRVWRWLHVQQSHRGGGSRVGGRDWWRPEFHDQVEREAVEADARGYTTARPMRDRD